jgi:hypothetical protein
LDRNKRKLISIETFVAKGNRKPVPTQLWKLDLSLNLSWTRNHSKKDGRCLIDSCVCAMPFCFSPFSQVREPNVFCNNKNQKTSFCHLPALLTTLPSVLSTVPSIVTLAATLITPIVRMEWPSIISVPSTAATTSATIA